MGELSRIYPRGGPWVERLEPARGEVRAFVDRVPGEELGGEGVRWNGLREDLSTGEYSGMMTEWTPSDLAIVTDGRDKEAVE